MKRPAEAYLYAYAVFAFKGDERRRVLLTLNVIEAQNAARAAEPDEVRIVYFCRAPLFKSNREYVCGNMNDLRHLDEKARTR